MAHQIIMLAVAILVAGAMATTMLWFFRKLRDIESQRVGPKE